MLTVVVTVHRTGQLLDPGTVLTSEVPLAGVVIPDQLTRSTVKHDRGVVERPALLSRVLVPVIRTRPVTPLDETRLEGETLTDP
ncbi:hypothetical protein V1J52_25950, partial [Streptomyces sp. TRM 70351]|uniref:hypothetical protein n=1 Tax=Streptomyces sp. TRM 70351 TaxID=3116552 RepID=UPI002E7AC0B9